MRLRMQAGVSTWAIVSVMKVDVALENSLIVAAAFAIASASCGGNTETPRNPCDTSAQWTPPPEAVTFAYVQARVFDRTCAVPSCHGTSGMKGNLVLTSQEAYASLMAAVDNTAAAKAGKKRVVPHDPAASYLVQKLREPASDEGERMPPGGSGLSQESMAIVCEWIRAGAPP